MVGIESVGIDSQTHTSVLGAFIRRGFEDATRTVFTTLKRPRLKRVEVSRHGVTCVYFDAETNRWFTYSWSVCK